MTKLSFRKVFIANRGEIALRISRTCNKLNLPSVISVSEADLGSHFSKQAGEIALLPGSSANDTYLNQELIIKLALEQKCDAIHPGYGFLSENADFAEKVISNGLVFVGPSPGSIRALGNKSKARDIAKKCKVPLTRGTPADLNDADLIKMANKLGYPLLVKAVAGGGGRGMRVVNSSKELSEALPLARAEAQKNFLDSRVYLEDYLARPRHVEVQLLGDQMGNVVHVGTRDCSMQRRHQKLIEEAPAPFLKPALRKALHESGIKIAKAVDYYSAGTAEFLVAGEKYYFLEMNTRIQVEHPVSEEISGLDLIEWQLRVADGQQLPKTMRNFKPKRHSIEYRLNAEDCRQNFMPATGPIEKLAFPAHPGLRVECGFEAGDRISPYYDGLLAKVIISAESREQAVALSADLLPKILVDGIPTTLDFHKWAVNASSFIAGPLDVSFVQREFTEAAEKLLSAYSLTDTEHLSLFEDKQDLPVISYASKKFRVDYEIKIFCLPDKTFLALPFRDKKRWPREEYCRRSNSFTTAVNALKAEVLEQISPAKIF